MGLCVSGNRPRTRPTVASSLRRGEERLDRGIGERYAHARPSSPSLDRRGLATGGVKTSGTAKLPVDAYGREEARLTDLFSALRTGLVFSTNEFSVLPGIATTAVVNFSIGSSALSGDSTRKAAENEENSSEDQAVEEDYELSVSLYGAPWTRGIRMQFTMWPVVGMFAKRKLVFTWNDNVLKVAGCERGELNARSLPVSFDTEREFCRCCLVLAYQSDSSGNLHVEFEDGRSDTPVPSDSVVASLSSLAYHTAISNLDAIPKSLIIPLKLIHQLYGSNEPVSLTIRVWPSTYANQYAASPVMKVKSGLVFAEFIHLVKEHFHLPASHTVKLYHNYRPIQPSDLVTSSYGSIDCFVISYGDREETSSAQGSGMEDDSNATLVVSLVGCDVQNVEASLEMKLGDFDRKLRKHFRLGSESFLIVVAEDDFAPQYTSSDNWKLIFPFSLPESSFGAGLRRSMRRLSFRRRSQQDRASQRQGRASQSQRQLRTDTQGQPFIPEIEEILSLLSSNSRNFPSNGGKFAFTVEELYESMPMYELSLEQCGIHPYTIIQVFEVTGPSIPIKFRVLSEHEQASRQPGKPQPEDLPQRVSRHANVMDINPSWSIHTFLQYVDAVISPASGTRRKRVSLNDRFIEDSEDLSKLSLGELLDLWKPAWWHRKGGGKQLSIKDIDPAEFLLVEKHSQSSARHTGRR